MRFRLDKTKVRSYHPAAFRMVARSWLIDRVYGSMQKRTWRQEEISVTRSDDVTWEAVTSRGNAGVTPQQTRRVWSETTQCGLQAEQRFMREQAI